MSNNMEIITTNDVQQPQRFKCKDSFSRFFCIDLTGSCRCTPSFRSKDTNGETIDIEASFSPSPRTLVILWKLAVWALQFYAYAIIEKGGGFYFAFATTWALVLSTFYSCFSLLNSIFPVQQPQSGTCRVGYRVQTTWILFLLASNSEMIVTIMFWVLLYKGGVPTTYAIMSHGIVCLTVWIDGLIINRIPVRARHWFEISVWYSVLYLIWSYIHAVADIGNPNSDDTDLLYPVLDWENNPTKSVIVAVGVTFVLSPTIHMLTFAISRCGRRYVVSSEEVMEINDKCDDESDVEECLE